MEEISKISNIKFNPTNAPGVGFGNFTSSNEKIATSDKSSLAPTGISDNFQKSQSTEETNGYDLIKKTINAFKNNTQAGVNIKKAANPVEKQMSESEKKMVEELKKIDSKVRSHENAHLTAAAGLVKGGPTYTYRTGPDGRQYAIGGEVQIDTSEVPDDPEATLRKMQQVQRAALAPPDPSPQDQSAAQHAQQAQSKAIMEMSKKIVDNAEESISKNKVNINPNQEQNTQKTQNVKQENKIQSAVQEQKKEFKFTDIVNKKMNLVNPFIKSKSTNTNSKNNPKITTNTQALLSDLNNNLQTLKSLQQNEQTALNLNSNDNAVKINSQLNQNLNLDLKTIDNTQKDISLELQNDRQQELVKSKTETKKIVIPESTSLKSLENRTEPNSRVQSSSILKVYNKNVKIAQSTATLQF
ncbi:MAG: hypothetical protein HW421_2639 [Ignavibacteria bacterium]|nr:hypothetical protein [Ignavibacteria bacterium]